MTDINKLSRIDILSDGDLFDAWSTGNGDRRAVAASVAAEYFQDKITPAADMVTQYDSPSATGQTRQVNDASQSVFFLVTPLASYAAMTIKLPALANAVDKQEVLVFTTQPVTSTLTVDGNGASVLGAPGTLAANGFFRLRYDSVNRFWYRVG